MNEILALEFVLRSYSSKKGEQTMKPLQDTQKRVIIGLIEKLMSQFPSHKDEEAVGNQVRDRDKDEMTESEGDEPGVGDDMAFPDKEGGSQIEETTLERVQAAQRDESKGDQRVDLVDVSSVPPSDQFSFFKNLLKLKAAQKNMAVFNDICGAESAQNIDEIKTIILENLCSHVPSFNQHESKQDSKGSLASNADCPSLSTYKSVISEF